MLMVVRRGQRLRRLDKQNDLFKGEVGRKKHGISTNGLSVD